jgi:hypothetical protein
MSTTAANSVNCHKIDPSKLSFFDLPAEVREKIYLHYFPHSEDIYIHLVYDTTQSDDKRYWTKQKARLSSKHRSYLYPRRTDKFGVLRSGDNVHDATDTLERRYRSVADMLAGPPHSGLVWTNLEAAARTLFKEASRYSYLHEEFKIFKNDGGSLPHYHNNLAVVPKQLLSKIQRLSITSPSCKSYEDIDNVWTSDIWTCVLTQMTNLRELCIRFASLRSICHHLQSLTTTKAWFMGRNPNVCLEIDVHTLRHTPSPHLSCSVPDPLPDNVPPRVIIPPLQKLTLYGFTTSCPITSGFFASLTNPADAAYWNGATFRHLATTPKISEWFHIVCETFEMVWPQSAPAAANANATTEICRMLESRTHQRFLS